ncbi:MAG: DMT family transporter [Solirubrobacteraceae bacterium]
MDRGAGGGSPLSLGDLLVLASAVLSAGFITAQPRLLDEQDPAAVTAVQFAAAGLVALPIAVVTGGTPAIPADAGAVLAFAALSLVGTLLPFWLFAFGQARVTAEVAGAFVNLEPLVGAAIGWLAFGDATAPVQIGGAFAVLAGILVGTMPWRSDRVGRRLGHEGYSGGRIRRIRRVGERQRRTVPMIQAPGRGPQNRLSLAWPRLSPIRK